MDSATPSGGAQLLMFYPCQLEDSQALIRAVKGNQQRRRQGGSAAD
jgi:hypothetical protein